MIHPVASVAALSGRIDVGIAIDFGEPSIGLVHVDAQGAAKAELWVPLSAADDLIAALAKAAASARADDPR